MATEKFSYYVVFEYTEIAEIDGAGNRRRMGSDDFDCKGSMDIPANRHHVVTELRLRRYSNPVIVNWKRNQ